MKLLKKLMEAHGVSGNEQEVRAIILQEIKKYIKDVKIDKFGNVVAHQKGKGPKVMLVAHMDEIGLIARSVSEKGDIYCSEVGTTTPALLIGHKVRIKAKKGYIHGVVTMAEVSDDEEIEELPKIEDLIVDTGLNKKELARLGIGVGSFLELKKVSEVLGSNDIISGKALDDRIGCYILIELAKNLIKSDAEIYYVFTVQEEVGLFGSKTSIYSIDPDWAIVVDVTEANDSKEHPHEITKELGKGPCITVKDADMIANVCIDDWLRKIAKKKKIAVQLDVSDSGTTDALSISVAKGGIPTTVVGVAVRNLHTTFGIAHAKDVENAIRLLYEFLKNPPKACAS
ncbi:M42 family peptidase [Candidatus Woesearchaeota archaeon]|nr:M42 family peptidase [Candidatus Woesearchaeota archaeon]